jgi:histone acetyltransferase MYST1
MTRLDETGYHVVGYFSKEKYSELGYNLACILTLPCHQRAGYGRFLIQFCECGRGWSGRGRGRAGAPCGCADPRPLLESRCAETALHWSSPSSLPARLGAALTAYELSKKEAKVGSPEKPLSDLGLLSYRSYWAWQILGVLRALGAEGAGEVSVFDLVRATSIKPDDVISTLQHLGLIRYITGSHVLAAPPETVEKEWARLDAKPGPVVDPRRIHWAPYRDPAIKRDKWALANMLTQHGGAAPGE